MSLALVPLPKEDFVELREEQKLSVQQPFRGRDLLAVLPTGFGKSLFCHAVASTRFIRIRSSCFASLQEYRTMTCEKSF